MKTILFLFLMSGVCHYAAALDSSYTDVPFLSVDDTTSFINNLNRPVEAEGRVHAAFWVRGRTLIISFRPEREGFSAVAFADNRDVLDEEVEGDIQKAVNGRLVRVRGIVQMYRGRPQIVISSPNQIEILD